jgi:hypothetical protein
MKFVRLGDYVINVSEIQAVKKVGAGCIVFMRDESEYRISSIDDEEFENAIAYICCGGADDGKTDKG